MHNLFPTTTSFINIVIIAHTCMNNGGHYCGLSVSLMTVFFFVDFILLIYLDFVYLPVSFSAFESSVLLIESDSTVVYICLVEVSDCRGLPQTK